jgi:hypothetical protein
MSDLKVSSTQLPTATTTVLGVVKPDGVTTQVNTNGVLSAAVGGSEGYKPDDVTIDLTEDEKLRLKDADSFVKTTDAQSIGGVKTFTDTDIHVEGIQIIGAQSRIEMEGQNGGTIDGGCVKLCFHANTSNRTPGGGGDLSLILYGTGVHPGDMGFGITPYSLNIKAGGGDNAIHLLNGTKHLAIFGNSGVQNIVLAPQESEMEPVTDQTEIGIKAFRTSDQDIGLEMRVNATDIVQYRFSVVTGVQKRVTTNNGETWEAWTALAGLSSSSESIVLEVPSITSNVRYVPITCSNSSVTGGYGREYLEFVMGSGSNVSKNEIFFILFGEAGPHVLRAVSYGDTHEFVVPAYWLSGGTLWIKISNDRVINSHDCVFIKKFNPFVVIGTPQIDAPVGWNPTSFTHID